MTRQRKTVRTSRKEDARVKVQLQEGVTAQASADQRTPLWACRTLEMSLRVLTSLKEPPLPEPAWAMRGSVIQRGPQISIVLLPDQ
jgi:hypothetical protein